MTRTKREDRDHLPSQDYPTGVPEPSLVRDAAALYNVGEQQMSTALRAARLFSAPELEVMEKMLALCDAGVPARRREAVARGLTRALEALREPEESDPLAVVDEPMSPAQAAEAVAWSELEREALRDGVLRQSVSAAEAGRLVGRSRQSIERTRRAGRILALRVRHQWRYPRWQLDADAPGGVLPGLAEVLEHLALSPAGAAFWLLRPHPRLGGATPLEMLRRRQTEEITRLAEEHGYPP